MKKRYTGITLYGVRMTNHAPSGEWFWVQPNLLNLETALGIANDKASYKGASNVALMRTFREDENYQGKTEEFDGIEYGFDPIWPNVETDTGSEYIALMEDDYRDTLQYGVQFRTWTAEGRGQWVWVRENVSFENAVVDLENVIAKVGANSARLLKTSGSNPWASPREDEIVITEEATEEEMFTQAGAEPGDLFLVKPEERRYTEVHFTVETHIKFEGV